MGSIQKMEHRQKCLKIELKQRPDHESYSPFYFFLLLFATACNSGLSIGHSSTSTYGQIASQNSGGSTPQYTAANFSGSAGAGANIQQNCVACHTVGNTFGVPPLADSTGNVSYAALIASGYIQAGNINSPLCQVSVSGESATSPVHAVINEVVSPTVANTICGWIEAGALNN